MLVKLTYVGPETTNQKNGKNFREVGAEEWNGEKKSAWDRVSAEFATLKAGDQVDVLLSDNGKYVNKVSKAGANPTPASGGKAWSKGTSSNYQPDPEKNVSVYTSYVLEYLIAPQMKTPLTVEEAVDLVFKIRATVKGRL